VLSRHRVSPHQSLGGERLEILGRRRAIARIEELLQIAGIDDAERAHVPQGGMF